MRKISFSSRYHYHKIISDQCLISSKAEFANEFFELTSLVAKVFLFFNKSSLSQMRKGQFSNRKESSMLKKSAMQTKLITIRTPI